jgi:hypothetical protein
VHSYQVFTCTSAGWKQRQHRLLPAERQNEQIVMEEVAPKAAANPSYLYNPARSARHGERPRGFQGFLQFPMTEG